jgi:hypothetical protein
MKRKDLLQIMQPNVFYEPQNLLLNINAETIEATSIGKLTMCFIVALRSGHIEASKLLLDTNKIDPNVKYDQYCPLICAIKQNQLEFVQKLLCLGANIHLDQTYGNFVFYFRGWCIFDSILCYALAYNTTTKIIQTLVESGAKLEVYTRDENDSILRQLFRFKKWIIDKNVKMIDYANQLLENFNYFISVVDTTKYSKKQKANVIKTASLLYNIDDYEESFFSKNILSFFCYSAKEKYIDILNQIIEKLLLRAFPHKFKLKNSRTRLKVKPRVFTDWPLKMIFYCCQKRNYFFYF